jgi:DNA-binding NtrC family response regulator
MDKEKASFRILLVEDSPSFRDAVTLLVGVYNDIDAVATIAEARGALEKNPYDVVILDRFLPDGDGLDLIAEIKRENRNTAVIIVTSDSDFNTVKRSIGAGADDYVVKTDNVAADLLIRIPFAVARLATDRKLTSLETRVKQVIRQEMVGRSPAVMEIRNTIFSVKGSQTPVLITGESGTGKELVAQMLHSVEAESKRERPLIVVNCAEIQETLSRSDLFGHERGSFTGATESKPGRFELAHNGDIFLDEIGDLPLEAQGKLLRVIQEGKIYRVGGTKPIKVSCRVIAATHQDLEDMVRRKRFRLDLFYRLNVVRINTTPLRSRKEDIPDLASFFALEFTGPAATISDRAMKRLQEHDWPGNIRELRNTIERASILMRKRKGERIDLEDIEISSPLSGPDAGIRRLEAELPDCLGALSEKGYKEFLRMAEREYLRAALSHADGSVAEVASRIGLGRSTLFRRMAEVGLPRRVYGYGLRVDTEESAEKHESEMGANT